MKTRKDVLKEFSKWYDSLPRYGTGPAKGTISGALIVLEGLKEQYDLSIDAHTAKRGTQIKGASGVAVRRILERFGETRRFVSEGGRTNRGLLEDIEKLLKTLQNLGLHELTLENRNSILEELQEVLVDKVKEFHSRKRIEFTYDPSKSTWQLVHQLLAVARENNKEGPVAQYLIGAKLQVRFPEVEVGNESFSTADEQLKRPGDFLVGDTAFHVTVAPMPGVYEKCKRNIEQGCRAYLLVPDRMLIGARQNAEQTVPGQVAVESIESFVAQNIEEISLFARNRIIGGLYRLLEIYNQRVAATEIDKSMLIEIPRNLKPEKLP